MTDNEIIKALEHCLYKSHRESKCTECEHVTGCKPYLLREALDLINRQNAEIEEKQELIERLQNANVRALKGTTETVKANARAEAIKEFAERLRFEIVNKPSTFKAVQATADFLTGMGHRQHEILDDINNLVKEMVGDE